MIRRRETPLGSPSRARTRYRAAHLKQSSLAYPPRVPFVNRTSTLTWAQTLSVNNLARMLKDLGRIEEALAAAEEAVRLFRALADSRPDAFTPNLASSLINLTTTLGASGRSPTKVLSMLKRRCRVRGRRVAWRVSEHRSEHRWVWDCARREVGRRSWAAARRGLIALLRRTTSAVIARSPTGERFLAARVADAANDVLAAKLFQIVCGAAKTVLCTAVVAEAGHANPCADPFRPVIGARRRPPCGAPTVRFAADLLLEGDGFEPSVPPRKRRPWREAPRPTIVVPRETTGA